MSPLQCIAVYCFSLYYEPKHIYYIFFGFQQLTNNDCLLTVEIIMIVHPSLQKTTTKELRVIEHYSGIWFCAQCINL